MRHAIVAASLVAMAFAATAQAGDPTATDREFTLLGGVAAGPLSASDMQEVQGAELIILVTPRLTTAPAAEIEVSAVPLAPALALQATGQFPCTDACEASGKAPSRTEPDVLITFDFQGN